MSLCNGLCLAAGPRRSRAILFSGCELGIGHKPSAQGAAKPYVVETEDWDVAANIPLLVPSRDFIAVKLQLEAMAAAARCRRARRIAGYKSRRQSVPLNRLGAAL
jgi:hypothetical protein